MCVCLCVYTQFFGRKFIFKALKRLKATFLITCLLPFEHLKPTCEFLPVEISPNYSFHQDVGVHVSAATHGELCSVPGGNAGHPVGAMEEDPPEAV